MSTPRAIARVVSSLADCTIALTACASETRDPVAPATAPQFELVTITSMVAVPVEEFSLADENGNNLACVKQTPSEQLLYKDDEAGTPSQPCPPSYQVVGKGQAIKVDKTWFTEDANRNGSVCLKTWDTTNDFIVHDDNTSTPSQPCAPALAVLVYGQAAEPADPAEPAPAEPAK